MGIRRRTSVVTEDVGYDKLSTLTPDCSAPLRLGYGDLRWTEHACSASAHTSHTRLGLSPLL